MRRFQPSFHSLWMVGVGRKRNVLNRLGTLWSTLDEKLTGFPFQIFFTDFQKVRSNFTRLVPDLVSSLGSSSTSGRCTTGSIGSQTVRSGVCVAFLNLNVHRWNAQLFRQNLGICCFVTLSLRLGSKASDRLPCWVDSDLSTVKHLDAEDIKILGRAGPNNFSEAGDADTHQLTSGTLLCLLLAQFLIAHHVHCLAQRWGIVTGVIFPSQCRAVGELIFLNEVLEPKICRIPS